MGWRGTLRAIAAAQRAAERQAARQRRAYAKLHAHHLKLLELQEYQQEVEAYENHISWLLSVHKESSTSWDWEEIRNTDPPREPIRTTRHEETAREAFNQYAPGLVDRVTGEAKKERERLTGEIVKAYERDEEDYYKALKNHEEEKRQWLDLCRIADGVLQKNPTAYLEAIGESGLFEDIEELGKYVEFTVDRNNSNYVEATLYVHEEEIVPREVKSLLKTGKLSVKKMPVSQFNQLYQDYVCSCILRLAAEIFAILPVDLVIIHTQSILLQKETGHTDWQTVISAAIPRQTLSQLNLQELDCSDSLKNFVHTTKFAKTTGFSAVEPLKPEDVGITPGERQKGETITIRAKETRQSGVQPPPLDQVISVPPNNNRKLLALGAALFLLPTVLLTSVFSPWAGLVLSGLGMLFGSLMIIDSKLKRQGLSLFGSILILFFLFSGGVGLARYYEAKESAQRQAESIARQKEATEKVAGLIQLARSSIRTGEVNQAIAHLKKATLEVDATNRPEAQSLLGELERATSPVTTTNTLMAMSDQQFSEFQKRRMLSDTTYFTDPDINSFFQAKLKTLDKALVEKAGKARAAQRAELLRLQKEAARRAAEEKKRIAASLSSPPTTYRSPQVNEPSSSKQIVYVTRTGAKYHRAGCRYLRSSAIPIALSSAKAGYSPCSVCDPP